MRRVWPALMSLGLAAGGCDEDETCEGDECDTDADTGLMETDAPEAGSRAGSVTLEVDIRSLPGDNRIELICAGRTLVDVERPNAPVTRTWSFPVVPGDACEVRLSDERGGRLPGGRLFNCSRQVAAWDSQRGTRAVVAEATMERCVPGCVDPDAMNHDPSANDDDGSCNYTFGCTQPDALNYDPMATRDDGNCDFGGFGRIEIEVFTNSTPRDTTVRLVCGGRDALTLSGLTTAWATEVAATNVDAGFVCDVILGNSTGGVGPAGRVSVCAEPVLDWDPVVGQGRAWQEVVGTITTRACSGCTDPRASNYDADAVVDNGRCTYP